HSTTVRHGLAPRLATDGPAPLGRGVGVRVRTLSILHEHSNPHPALPHHHGALGHGWQLPPGGEGKSAPAAKRAADPSPRFPSIPFRQPARDAVPPAPRPPPRVPPARIRKAPSTHR